MQECYLPTKLSNVLCKVGVAKTLAAEYHYETLKLSKIVLNHWKIYIFTIDTDHGIIWFGDGSLLNRPRLANERWKETCCIYFLQSLPYWEPWIHPHPPKKIQNFTFLPISVECYHEFRTMAYLYTMYIVYSVKKSLSHRWIIPRLAMVILFII